MFLSHIIGSSVKVCCDIQWGRSFSSLASPGLRMKDKVCVITGAASGIGLGIAEKFAQEGAKVVLADLNIEAATQAADLHKSKGLHVSPFKVDITNEEQVQDTIRFAEDTYGGLDVIVSNAGYQHVEAVDEVSLENWEKMLKVHVTGGYLCTKYAMKAMKKSNKGGSIIYMGSIHSKISSPLKAPYITAKHGLLGLSRAVAKEGAPHNIRSNVICPGFVWTPLVKNQIPPLAAKFKMTEEEVIKNVLLKDTVDFQFTTIDDVAEVAIFFAAFPSNALTGQSINVSHGCCMD